MCFAEDAQPPIPQNPHSLGDHGDLVLTSSDGTRFMAYRALPRQGTQVGVVILPDIRGLHDYYRALACRLAEHGVGAIAIDYFSRTAGVGARDDDFDYQRHRASLQSEHVAADTRAAILDLRARGPVRVLSLGFCFGGGQSWRQSAAQEGLAGAIGLYGRPAAVADAIGSMRAPILILGAGADQHISASDYRGFETALGEASIEHEMHIYPGVPHSFFDRSFAEHAEACADAWARIRGFIETHAGATLTA